MTRLALLLDQHPDAFHPTDPVRRLVIGPFETPEQIENELTRTFYGTMPFRKAGVVAVPTGDPDGILK
jgi:hypothetical protein